MYTIYSKAGCIFCDAAMELLDKHKLAYQEIKVPGNEEAMKLFKENQWKTVPQIFSSSGNYIGGYQDLKEAFDFPDNLAENNSF
jgi:glutaredoxin 3